MKSKDDLKGSQDYIDLGNELSEAKTRLGDDFVTWLDAATSWSMAEAERFMEIARLANEGRVWISESELENISREALYALCANSTPYEVRVTAFQMARQGTKVTHKMAKALIAGQSVDETTIITEAQLELAFCNWLTEQGIEYQRQVNCPVGRADVVTVDTIYELKHPIDVDGFFKAVGQVLLYREYINPDLRAVLVFVKPRTDAFNAFIEATKTIGIEVLLW